ncbi:MAG: hypothetical protein QM758_24170 [Armatimonas sp.]
METKTNKAVFARSKFLGGIALSALGIAAILGGCGGGDGDPVFFELSTTSILDTHTIGGSPCPQSIGTFDITNDDVGDVDFDITVPDGLAVTPSSVTIQPGKKATIAVSFTCTKQPPLNGTIQVKGSAFFGTSPAISTESITVNIVKG